MSGFKLQTPETTSASGREALERAKERYGFTPNLIGMLANAPAAAHGYLDLGARFKESSLTPEEQQVVLLTTSFENECDYCMGAHSTVAGMLGLSDGDLGALRDGTELPTRRLDALRTFTRAIVQKRGWVSEEDLDAFRAAGFQHEQAGDVILGVGMKTISNYTNHIAGTPLDEAFEAQRWSAPAGTRAE